MTYNTLNKMKQGGAEWEIGGTLTFGADAIVDRSAMVETILVAGAITLTKNVTRLSAASGAYAVTLAAPPASMLGQTKVIEMTVAGNAITLALTNVIGGSASTTASFDAVNEALVLVAGTNKWLIVGQMGVTLS